MANLLTISPHLFTENMLVTHFGILYHIFVLFAIKTTHQNCSSLFF